jgi:hypothetical protein
MNFQSITEHLQNVLNGTENSELDFTALRQSVRWTPFFGQDCVKLSYDDHGWE